MWYLLNTDARSMPDGRSPHEKWFKYGMAFCAEQEDGEDGDIDENRHFTMQRNCDDG